MTEVSPAYRAPSLVSLSLGRTKIELFQFFRQSEQVFFTFLLPVLFVVIFGTVFDEDIEGPPGTEPVPFPQYFAAGMIAAGIMSVTFSSLATTVSLEQHDGTLKRLAGTPLPRAAYFAGKIGLATVTAILQVTIILTIGVAFYGMSLPTEAGLYGLFAVVFLLGIASCSLLGIAYTRLIKTATSAAAVVQPPYLVLMFISGVFFVYSAIPGWLQFVASLFPLKWLVQGMRQVFLPDWIAVEDYGGSWQTEWVLLVLAGWLVASFLIALFTFRWDRSGTEQHALFTVGGPAVAKIVKQRMAADIEGDFVVFLIGMRINKLWKFWKWLPIFMAMPKMLAELEKNPDSGFLGANQYMGSPRRPMLVQYWRSFEHLENYARNRDAKHWPAWVAFNKKVGSNGDVGIWHETYLVPAGSYECIYNNMTPIGLGKFAGMVPASGRKSTAAGRAGLREKAYPEEAVAGKVEV